jgi:hypothetical protein
VCNAYPRKTSSGSIFCWSSRHSRGRKRSGSGRGAAAGKQCAGREPSLRTTMPPPFNAARAYRRRQSIHLARSRCSSQISRSVRSARSRRRTMTVRALARHRLPQVCAGTKPAPTTTLHEGQLSRVAPACVGLVGADPDGRSSGHLSPDLTAYGRKGVDRAGPMLERLA